MALDREPAYSCQTIDTYLTAIEGGKSEVSEIESFADRVADTLKELVEGFEYCRSQCEDLREWGQEWRNRAQELEEDLKCAQAEMRELEHDYEIRINDLERELARADELAREGF